MILTSYEHRPTPQRGRRRRLAGRPGHAGPSGSHFSRAGPLGPQPVAVPCTLDLAAVRQALLELGPDLVVNLVESLGGSDSLAHLAAALMDALGFPYTGSHTEALFARITS